MKKKSISFCFFSILAICIGFFLFSFLTSNQKDFVDMVDLVENQPAEYNRYPLCNAIPLIPNSATQIKVIYKGNRVKNIQIYFNLKQSVQNAYVKTIKAQLHEYSIMNPNDTRRKIIFFKGTEHTCFKQINFTFSGNSIEIKTF